MVAVCWAGSPAKGPPFSEPSVVWSLRTLSHSWDVPCHAQDLSHQCHCGRDRGRESVHLTKIITAGFPHREDWNFPYTIVGFVPRLLTLLSVTILSSHCEFQHTAAYGIPKVSSHSPLT